MVGICTMFPANLSRFEPPPKLCHRSWRDMLASSRSARSISGQVLPYCACRLGFARTRARKSFSNDRFLDMIVESFRPRR